MKVPGAVGRTIGSAAAPAAAARFPAAPLGAAERDAGGIAVTQPAEPAGAGAPATRRDAVKKVREQQPGTRPPGPVPGTGRLGDKGRYLSLPSPPRAGWAAVPDLAPLPPPPPAPVELPVHPAALDRLPGASDADPFLRLAAAFLAAYPANSAR